MTVNPDDWGLEDEEVEENPVEDEPELNPELDWDDPELNPELDWEEKEEVPEDAPEDDPDEDEEPEDALIVTKPS